MVYLEKLPTESRLVTPAQMYCLVRLHALLYF